MDDASRGANATLTVDLEAQEIRGPDGGVVHFEIDPFKKHCMLNGLDGDRPDPWRRRRRSTPTRAQPGRPALGVNLMGAVIEFLLVGRSPLGSAIRAVVIAVLLVMFWTLFIVDRWQLLRRQPHHGAGRRRRRASLLQARQPSSRPWLLRTGMDAESLRTLQAPLKERYREEPDGGADHAEGRGHVDDATIACKVETGRALVDAGLHPATGGTGWRPAPATCCSRRWSPAPA